MDVRKRVRRLTVKVEILFVQNAMERAIRDFSPRPRSDSGLFRANAAAFPGQLDAGPEGPEAGQELALVGQGKRRPCPCSYPELMMRSASGYDYQAFTDSRGIDGASEARLEQETPEGYQAIVEWGLMATPQLATEAAEQHMARWHLGSECFGATEAGVRERVPRRLQDGRGTRQGGSRKTEGWKLRSARSSNRL